MSCLRKFIVLPQIFLASLECRSCVAVDSRVRQQSSLTRVISAHCYLLTAFLSLFKNLFDLFSKQASLFFERQWQRWIVLPCLDRIHALPRDFQLLSPGQACDRASSARNTLSRLVIAAHPSLHHLHDLSCPEAEEEHQETEL